MDALDKRALEVVVNDFKLIFALAFALAFNLITDDDLDREALKEADFLINTPDIDTVGCKFEDICKRVYGIVVRNWRGEEDERDN